MKKLILVIVILLIVGGGVYYYKNSEQVEVQPETTDRKASQDNNDVLNNSFDDWLTYNNNELGFSVKYPKSYHVSIYGNNLVNYDENKYEKGNSNGVKIQFHKYKTEYMTLSEGMESYENGIFKFKEEILSGPGGQFKVYSTLDDIGIYYKVIVWGEDNDGGNVFDILSTFEIL